jgi:TolB-like protein/Tfp pilus assembly protein PilF
MRDVRNQLEDLKREDSTDMRSASVGPQQSRHQRGRGLLVAALIVAVTLVGYLAWRQSDTPNEAPVADALLEPASDRKMIVVLPFENLGEPEDKYFADGMTEEITSRLAALKGLGVISRTSALQYAANRPTLAQIGEELGVGYVLEGTVRWQRLEDGSSQVRVTPQLIRVADDTHLWAEQFDARLENIFDVQSNIAHRVSEKLGVALLETEIESLDAKPTESLEAYDFFLQGNEYLTRGMEINRPRDVEIAIEMYTKAARLDEDFALAYARQATAHSWLYSEYFDRSDSRVATARASVEKAMALRPGLPEAHQALAGIYHADRQMTQALLEYQAALERQPSNAEILESIAWVQTDLGLWEESFETLKKAMTLNPRLGRLACWAGGRCFGLRDFKNAIDFHDRAIHLTPDRSCPYACQTWIYMSWDGETARARRVLEEIPNDMDMESWPPLNYPWFTLEMMDGDFTAALEILDQGTKKAYEFRAFYIPKDLLRAQVYELKGERDRGRTFYESARDHLLSKIEQQPEDARLRSALGIAYAGLGDRESATRQGELSLELLLGSQAERLGYILKDMAQIYTMLGEKDKALDQIQRLLSTPAMFAAGYFQLDPTWESLRSETRFQDLMRKHQQHTDHA